MNVFFYDIVKKVRLWGWCLVVLGGLIILGGYYLSKDETLLDQIAAVLTGNPTAEDVIGMGIPFVVIGLIWSPVCALLISSLEKTLTDDDRRRLELPRLTRPAPATPPVNLSVLPVLGQPESPVPSESPEASIPQDTPPILMQTNREGTYWLPASAFALATIGLLGSLGLCGDVPPDEETFSGIAGLNLLGLIMTITSVVTQRKKGVVGAIIGIVLSVVGLVVCFTHIQ